MLRRVSLHTPAPATLTSLSPTDTSTSRHTSPKTNNTDVALYPLPRVRLQSKSRYRLEGTTRMSMISDTIKKAFTTNRMHRRLSAFIALLLIATVLLDPFSYGFRSGAGEQSGLFGANSASAAALRTSNNQTTPLPPAPTAS